MKKIFVIGVLAMLSLSAGTSGYRNPDTPEQPSLSTSIEQSASKVDTLLTKLKKIDQLINKK